MADYCFSDLGSHEQVQCAEYPQGQIDSFAFMETDHAIADFTSASDWNTAIAANNVTVFKNVKGTLAEPSELTQTNPVGAGTANIPIGNAQEFTWTDSNVSADNDTLYGTLNGRSGYLAVRMSNESKIRVFEIDVLYSAQPVTVPEDKSLQYYKGAARFEWDREGYSIEYAEPSGIFDV